MRYRYAEGLHTCRTFRTQRGELAGQRVELREELLLFAATLVLRFPKGVWNYISQTR